MRRRTARAFGAAVATVALVLGGAVAAHANPAPDSGPIAGGTKVKVPYPLAQLSYIDATETSNTLYLTEDGSIYNPNSWVQILHPKVDEGVIFTRVIDNFVTQVAMDSNGDIYSWGQGLQGQLGNGASVNSTVPVRVQAPAVALPWASVSTGSYHQVAIGADGKTYAWGQNSNGQLGIGSFGGLRNTPVEVITPDGVSFTEVVAGPFATVALGTDGKAYVWGDNGLGLTGITQSHTPLPVEAPGSLHFTSVSINLRHTLAIASDGSIYAWGDNSLSQLGDGTTDSSSQPVLVQTPAGVRFTDIAAAQNRNYALSEDGELYGWGTFGALGGTFSTPEKSETAPGGASTFTKLQSFTAHGDDGVIYSLSKQGNRTNWLRQPPIEVTQVTFGGVAGSTPVYEINWDDWDGVDYQTLTADWTVETPARATAGPVDVVVHWTFNGVVQTPITYINGLTYVDPNAPVFTTHPLDASEQPGDDAVFTAAATGSPTPTLTWQVSTDGGTTWVPITAGVSPDGTTLTVPVTVDGGGNRYRAVADNGLGDPVPSTSATLTVLPTAPVFTTNPVDASEQPGHDAVFAAAASGHPDPALSWEVSTDGGTTWAPITAGVSPDGTMLTVPVTVDGGGNRYRAVADNGVGAPVLSAAATLAALPIPPVFTTNPADASKPAGENAVFTAAAAGVPAPTLTWQVSTDGGSTWVPVIAGVSADGGTLTVPVTDGANGNRYRAVADNGAGAPVPSAAATLTVTPPASQPAGGAPNTPEVDKSLEVTGGAVPITFGVLGGLALLAGLALFGRSAYLKSRAL